MAALTKAAVRSLMQAKAEGSGLGKADITKLKLTPLTAESMKSIEGLPQYLAGFQIPYFDLDGKVTKFFRVRYVEEPTGFVRMTMHKPIRYAQPKGTVNEVYLAPFVDWKTIATDTEQPLIFTEGELKAACATLNDMPTLGLGGVTMFSDRKRGNFVLPQLKRFKWDNRRVFVVFDSDAATNPNVLRAEAMLCRELTQLGAVPSIVRLPALGEGKTGMDDFIVSEGPEAMVELLRSEAKSYGEARALFEMNEEVLFVQGSNIVYAPERDLRMRPADFTNSQYANRRFLVHTDKGPAEKRTASEWIRWEYRAEVESFTYRPGGEPIEGQQYNLWKPWPHRPVKGDVSMWHKLMEQIFSPTERESRKWFEQWLAYPMQHPGAKLKQAVLIHGGQGTGKSFTGEIVMRLYGEHNATKFDNAKLNSTFNDWAEHKQFAVGEEIVIHANEKRSVAEILKTLITDTTISINRKYVNAYRLPNCMNVVLFSNHAAALKLEEDDRRFFVHHVKAPKMAKALYEPLDKWSKSEAGLSALFHYFLTVDLTGFDPQAAAFQTSDRANMIAGGRSEHGAWVAELREHPDNVLKVDKAVAPFALYSSEDLLMYYKHKHDRTSITATTLGNELAMHGFKRAYPHPVRTAGGPKRLWVVRESPALAKITSPAALGEWYDKERNIKPKKAGKF